MNQSRNCLMICQERVRDQHSSALWVVSKHGEDLGYLPFDLAQFDVTPYTNNREGLETLREKLKKKILGNKGERIPGPVNYALDAVLKRNRTISYLLWGAGVGAFLGFVSSMVTAFIGTSFIYRYHESGKFIRTIYEGGPAGVFCGSLALAAYSIVYNS